MHLLIQQMRKKSLTSGAYIHDFSSKEKRDLPTQLKPKVWNASSFLFQPVQCEKASEKTKNKESYYILQLSDTSLKQGL